MDTDDTSQTGALVRAHDRQGSRFAEESWRDLSEALLDRLRGRLSLTQSPDERSQEVASTLQGFLQHSNGRFPPLTKPQCHDFLQTFLSYDLIEEFLEDPTIEDIMINSTGPIFVHRTGQGLTKTEKRFDTHRALAIFVKKLVVFAGRTEVDPINDVELFQIRGRVNIIHSPFGPQITITRGKAQPFTVLQLIDSDMMTYELAAQLWMYVEGLQVRPANLLIAGGPGSGKTTLLNALLSFIPRQDRVVTIEDTLELNTTCLENCSRLESCRRVTMPELVKNSVRMRPDRILVGEVRGAEAHDLMTVVNLGKYSMGTLHASSARETILRLQNEPMNVPPSWSAWSTPSSFSESSTPEAHSVGWSANSWKPLAWSSRWSSSHLCGATTTNSIGPSSAHPAAPTGTAWPPSPVGRPCRSWRKPPDAPRCSS